MSRRVLSVSLALLGFAAAAVIGVRLTRSPETVFEPRTRPIEAAPLCPWRNVEEDLRAFFPAATSHRAETKILSGVRVELAAKLKRPVTPEENALQLNHIFASSNWIGTVLTRRVKGEYGAIEVVAAFDTNAVIKGVRLQRIREPQPIAAALRNQDWLAAFAGKGSESGWDVDRDFPPVPPAARGSAAAVIDGVRSLSMLFTIPAEPIRAIPHHAP